MRVRTGNTLVNVSKSDSIELLDSSICGLYQNIGRYVIQATFGQYKIPIALYESKEEALNDLDLIEEHLKREDKILYL